MDFNLSKEHEMLRKAVREFAAKKIAPYADEWKKSCALWANWGFWGR